MSHCFSIFSMFLFKNKIAKSEHLTMNSKKHYVQKKRVAHISRLTVFDR